ncbi:MAG: PAS domain-containing sensor histidine kinase [Rhodospirillales bacterium]
MANVTDDVLNYLFDAASFMPHGVCLAWRPDLVALHVVSDLGIFLAYSTIPVALIYFVRRRKDLEYSKLFGLFAAFILFCGATHAFAIVILWYPLYGIHGVLKALTAIVSIMTAVMIWPIIPKALALPSPSQLRKANEELLAEIKQRKQVEEELRQTQFQLEQRVHERTRDLLESENRFKDFAEVSADWFWEQNQNLRFTFVSATNDVINRLTRDYVGKTRRETGIMGVSEQKLQAHEALLEAHQPFQDFKFQHRTDDGSMVHLSIRGKPVFDMDGIFAGYRGTGQDITRLVDAENAIIAERDKAERASRAKSSFLANMSHELRTPLNGIIGYSELLTSEAANVFDFDKRQRIIEDIHKASVHLLSIITSVLDLSRIESGHEEAAREHVTLGPAIRKCMDMMQGVALNKGLSMQYANEPDPITAHVDPKHLSQIIINLLSNAVKYTNENGTISINVGRDRDGLVKIELSDTGIGIHPQDLPRVFEEFERAGDVNTSNEGGTGLGLPLVKRLLELNGGAIKLESTVGAGTTAIITLPA